MSDNDLFQLAHGVTSPWFVAASAFDAAKKRLDIGVDFKAGSRFACPDCNAEGCPVHDTTEKIGGISTSSNIRRTSPRACRASPAPSAA
jgi:hypothetical protein